MCKACRGFNHGDNTHCVWCGDDLSYWTPLVRNKKRKDVVALNLELEEGIKRAEKKDNKKKFDWGF